MRYSLEKVDKRMQEINRLANRIDEKFIELDRQSPAQKETSIMLGVGMLLASGLVLGIAAGSSNIKTGALVSFGKAWF